MKNKKDVNDTPQTFAEATPRQQVFLYWLRTRPSWAQALIALLGWFDLHDVVAFYYQVFVEPHHPPLPDAQPRMTIDEEYFIEWYRGLGPVLRAVALFLCRIGMAVLVIRWFKRDLED